jgi:hypothetical protein
MSKGKKNNKKTLSFEKVERGEREVDCHHQQDERLEL